YSSVLPLPAAAAAEGSATITNGVDRPLVGECRPASAAAAARQMSSMPPSSATTLATTTMMPCMTQQQTPEITTTTTSSLHGTFNFAYNNPAYDTLNTVQATPASAISGSCGNGGLSSGAACWPVFVEEENAGENVGRQREWMVSPGMGSQTREPDLAPAEDDGDSSGDRGCGFEADSPVPPDYPWLSGSPVGAFGSPGGSSSAASGTSRSITNQSAPQHTDLSNLLDTSSSYSVAGGRDSGRDRDALQMLSSRSLCESSGQPVASLDHATGSAGTPAAGIGTQTRPNSIPGQHVREEEVEEQEEGFINPPDMLFQGGEPSFYLVGGLEGVHRRTPGVVLHQSGLWLGEPAWVFEAGSSPASLGAHTDEDNGEAATQGLDPPGNSGSGCAVGIAPGKRHAEITTLAGSAEGDRGSPDIGKFGPGFAVEDDEEAAAAEEMEEEDHQHSSVGSVVDDPIIGAAQEMSEWMAANESHGATELSETMFPYGSRPLSKSRSSDRQNVPDARHIWQHVTLQPRSWHHLQHNDDDEHDAYNFSMEPALAPRSNADTWISGDGAHHVGRDRR
ncbi:hypothetical protein Vretifemale_16305, partial [Volvox reticuliferus]